MADVSGLLLCSQAGCHGQVRRPAGCALDTVLAPASPTSM
jgi:hypothetical protein